VIVDVPDGYVVTQELIRRDVIVDYRPGAGIRLSPHFYNTGEEIDHAMDVLSDIVGSVSSADDRRLKASQDQEIRRSRESF
jgi:kynureninase